MRLFSISLSVIILYGCCFGSIPPVAMTKTTMTAIFLRVDIYAQKHQKIPYTYDVLPLRDGAVNEKVDGWGKEIIYEIIDDKIISLTSYGEDGKPGGDGENADIIRTHRLRKPDGSLWVGERFWVQESRNYNY